MKSFGHLLREARIASGKKLKDVAILLDRTVSNIHDIEQSHRKLNDIDDVKKCAEMLHADSEKLIKAAIRELGHIKIKRDNENELFFIFKIADSLDKLSNSAIKEIETIIERDLKGYEDDN